MPSAYVIANVKVTNPAQYEDYKRLSTRAIEAYGAEVCVRGGAITVLEGEWRPERIVVLKFESVAQAQAYYDSSEYSAARVAREGASVMNMIVVEGV